jgi:hypothetical protein
MKFSMTRLALAAAVALAAHGAQAQTPAAPAPASTLEAAITGGKASGVFNLRYEGVSEDNALDDAKALTLRSALKYTTGAFQGFSGVLEAEDVRVVAGMDDYSVPQTGFNPGLYSVITDPETTEINQGYLQYFKGGFMARLGRQDIRYDNQRFVGAVPWRQDYQSFDALTLQYKQSAYTLDYNYITNRERVFAQAADIKSKDHLLHGTVATAIGTVTGYAYLLEDDIPLNNALDTYGIRLNGTQTLGGLPVSYLAEYATQDYERGPADFSADYYVLEGGVTVQGINAKLGYEVLGSDNGAYGFATPLSTLHLFQGWADQFVTTPDQGIADTYLSLAATVPSIGGNATAVFHDYSADDSTPTIDDLGSEVDLQWTRPFRTNWMFGLKYADYQQGDIAAKVDKQVFWSWLTFSF